MDGEPESLARLHSCNLRTPADEADCAVDLKLGGLGAAEKWEEQTRSTKTASSSSPSKKPRPLNTASPNNALLCSVDGCSSDLRRCKEYHRRHKVCEAHSKTPVVTVGGVEQRFCQQCSRFHLLVEFDEEKRSCRKRLDGHNRRRRKPQIESTNSTVLFQNQQGLKLLADSRFSVSPYTSQIPPTDRSLLRFIDGEQNFPGCQFPLSQDGKTSFAAAAIRPPAQPILKTLAPTESCSNRVFSDGSTPQVLNSNCAHSLLSLPVQTASSNVGQLFPATNRMSIGQSLVSSLRDPRAIGSVSLACSQIENERECGVLVADAEAVDQRCQALFQVGGDGSSDGGSKSLPFLWQ